MYDMWLALFRVVFQKEREELIKNKHLENWMWFVKL